MPTNNVETVREFVQTELRAAYAVTFVRVERVIHDTQKAVVSLKSDSNIIIDNVPIASTWARDGAGIVVPIAQGDEGLVLHPREPLAKQIQQRGEQPPESDRRFELEDAILLPMLRLDEDSIPERDPNELVMKHDSGSYLRLDEKGVHIGPELYVDGIPVTEHVHGGVTSGGGTTEHPDDEDAGGAPEVS